MYSTIAQLPQPVLQLLEPKHQELFRSSYNLAEGFAGDSQRALQAAWSMTLTATADAEGSNRLSYLIDATSMEFDEKTNISWFQAFPHGTWHHPLHGEIKMGPAETELMVKQFKENVAGQDLDIDYDHKVLTREAAGWVKNAEVRSDGLYLAVEWTKDAAEKLKNKAYRYFSPEYAKEWTHPVTKQKHQFVLRGGALTNRPFLKGIQPINLSEAIDVGIGQTKPELSFNTGGSSMPMSPEQLAAARKNLNLPDTATEDDVTQAALEAATRAPEPKEVGAPQAPAPSPGFTATSITNPTTGVTAVVSANEREEMVKLAEGNPVIAKLIEGFATLEAAHKLSEVNHKLSEWSTPTNGRVWGVPTVVQEKLKNVMLSDSPTTAQFSEVLDELLKVGLVKLTETGHGPSSNPSNYDNPSKEADERIAKLMETDKSLDYGKALAKVFEADPALATAYFSMA